MKQQQKGNAMQRGITVDIDGFLPEIVLNYLQGLAEETPGKNHTFLLSRELLGGRELQGIWHTTEEGSNVHHKIYGFQPVEGSICIGVSESGF